VASILVVDDEPAITDVVARYLQRAGHLTRVAGDGPRAVAQVTGERPDLVVLDLMLPGFDGLEVLRRIREDERRDGAAPVAVILLTARGEEQDRIAGLNRGADDYMVKPFSPGELVARVEAVLRRSREAAGGGPGAPPIAVGDLEIDTVAHRVRRAGDEVELTPREFELLAHLARHCGRAFTREELLGAVWDLAGADTSTVTVHVRRLRTKLEDDPARPRHLQTVWGVGYRLSA
jgi:DNA-binding response OmpR family regulator